MSSTDTTPTAIIKQRKRFEALGNAINKADGMSNWLKVLFAFTLIFGLPTLALLVDPAKDGTITMYEIIIFGFRIILIAMILSIASRMTREYYTASNDFNMKTQGIGFKDSKTNTAEEKKHMINNIVYTILSILIILASFLGIFLVGSRYVEAYIIGQQIVYLLVITCLILTFKFWYTRGSEDSPRMGGRKIVQTMLPIFMFLAIEVIIDFFSVLNEARFRINSLQLSWGIVYPFLFLFLLIAVLISTKKTAREKQSLQDAKVAEIQRKEQHIQDKNRIKRIFFRMKVGWNKFVQIFAPRDPTKKKNIDRKPSKALVKSIWITLFIVIVPFALIISWNLFPQDGLLFIGALMISYQYSMMKYERYELDVISEPDKDDSIKSSEMRTPSLIRNTLTMILLPTLVFITAQYLLSGVIIGEIFTSSTEMIVVGFTWVAALMVIPISFQMYFKIVSNTDKDRSVENVSMYRNSLVYILVFEAVMLVCSLAGHFFAQVYVAYEYIQWVAMGLQLFFVVVLVVLPIVFLYIIPKVTDQGYKITKIVTLSLIFAINIAIFALFIVDIIIGYFL